MIAKEHVEEFKKIVVEEYGCDLSYEKAEIIANGLVDYYDLLAKMYHQTKPKNNQDLTPFVYCVMME